MAKSDWTNGQDRPEVLNAGERVGESVSETPDADARAFAETNEVATAAYANYADALEAHASRPDIEGLAERRAREYGTTFADADFMRQAAYNEDGTAATPPRPGTIHGDAPDAGGDETGDGDDDEGTEGG